MHEAHLRVYLNDHLSGAMSAIELIKQLQQHGPEEPLGTFLATLKDEVEEDTEVLHDLHHRVRGHENPVKKVTAKLAAKVEQMRPNQALTSYSDLNCLEDLEGLVLGVRGKMALWTSLAAVAPDDDRFDDVDFERLLDRAQRQHDRLEDFRVEAARQALAASGA